MTPQEIVDKIESGTSEVPYEVYFDINEFLDNDQEEDALFYLQNYFKCADNVAKEALMLYKKTIYVDHKKIIEESRASLTPEQIAYNNAVARELLNKPKCSTCQSTNVQKIGTGERMASVAVFGIFSKKINKSYKCKHCGYTW